MLRPSVCAANIRHERTAAPSTITVQAPHTPCSQPTWVPASNRSWRRKSLSSSRDSTLRRYSVPFTVTLISCRSTLTAGSFVRGRQCARGQNAGDMALIIFAGVDAAARIDGALHQRGGFGDFTFAELFADQRRARLVSIHRPVAGIAQSDARLDAFSLRVEAQHAGDTDNGEIAAPARHFQKARAGI